LAKTKGPAIKSPETISKRATETAVVAIRASASSAAAMKTYQCLLMLVADPAIDFLPFCRIPPPFTDISNRRFCARGAYRLRNGIGSIQIVMEQGRIS
jgi:hypothetical protein